MDRREVNKIFGKDTVKNMGFLVFVMVALVAVAAFAGNS